MKKIIYSVLLSLCTGWVYGQAGIGTTAPKSWLDVRGTLSATVRSFSSSATAGVGDHTLVFTGGSAAGLSLPDASTCAGRMYWVKNASTTLPTPVLTISPAASQTIEGGVSWPLDEPMETIRLASNGSSWYVYAEDIPVAKTSTTGGSWLEGGNILKAIKKIGTISNYDFPFVTNNLESMRLTAAGFLGVGTASPAGRLHFVSQNSEAGDDYIFDDYGTTVTQGIYLRKSRGTSAAGLDLAQGDLISQFRFTPHYNGSLPHNDGSGMDAYYQGNGTTNLTDLRVFSSNTEQLRINETGSTGIGTATWDASNPEKLKVDAGVTSSFNVISGKGTIDNYLQLNIQNNSNTHNASSDVVATAANGTETSNYVDMGINSGTYTNVSSPILGGFNNAYLYSLANDFVIGNASTGKDLVFFAGGVALTNEAMRITAAGNVGIGTSTPADKLSIADDFTPATDNAYSIGTSTKRWSAVYATNGSIQTSDRRLKTKIGPLPYGLNDLMEMQPVRYNWKEDAMENPKIGLLAQTVKGIIPEVVSGDESKEHLGMNYAELVPVLIKSIQEQQAQLEKLKLELARLQETGH